MRQRIEALAVDDCEGRALACPRVGTLSLSLAVGQSIEPGRVLGTLTALGRSSDVVAPAGCVGRVAEVTIRERGVAFGYGGVFARLTNDMGAPAHVEAETSAAEVDDAVAIAAQMDGQFYRRPSPDAPEFVAAGDVIEPGAKIGLIEVMKFFYPVHLEISHPVTVVRYVALDAAPVEAGQTLLVVRR